MILEEAYELIEVGKNLNIKVELLDYDFARNIIKKALELFKPLNIENHICIGSDYSIKLSIDKWEFNYMEYLPKQYGYIFFRQSWDLERRTVVKIENLHLLGKILENSFGIEYFLTNENVDFLISVNWYVIEAVGSASKFLKELI